MMRQVDAVLFDKDGTLFDFGATWDAWALGLIDSLSKGDDAKRVALASAAQFDLAAGQFDPSSPIIAGTHREATECLHQALPEWDLFELELWLEVQAAKAPLVEATPLVPFLAGLAAQDLGLGVMTNDTEAGARAHLSAVGVEGMFDFIAGFDSGYGAKPAPEPLLAFAKAMGLPPGRVVMVGDSTHDLIAGRAAGMRTVGVLTGPAVADDLAPYADAIYPDISYLADWVTAPA